MTTNQKIRVGIDLGTTNTLCYVAKEVDGKVIYDVVYSNAAEIKTPSVVSFEDSNIVVGEAAKRNISNKSNTVSAIKRLIGRKYSDPVVKQFIEHSTFKIEADSDDNPIIKVNYCDKETSFYPEQISAMVLGEIKENVKTKTGRYPDECVITVPAYFNNQQREATKRAAIIAGLDCKIVFNEPTAAAVKFRSVCRDFTDGKALIFDFGGGTLDISIIEVEGSTFRVLGIGGDTALGGEDFDFILMDYIRDEFKKQFGISIPDNDHCMGKIKDYAEKTKEALSSQRTVPIIIPNLYKGKNLSTSINQAYFESLCSDIISRVIDVIAETLEDVKIEPEELDTVILVGGSSNIPFIKDNVFEYLNKKPIMPINPTSAVAEGAAIICYKMAKGYTLNEITNIPVPKNHKNDLIELIDVYPVSLGLLSGRDHFQKYIFRNKPLPQYKDFLIRPMDDYAGEATIRIYMGEDEVVDEGEHTHVLVKEYTIKNLQRRASNENLMRFRLEIGKDYVLKLTGIANVESGTKNINLVIDTKEVLSGDKIREAIRLQDEIFNTKAKYEAYKKMLSELYSLISSKKGKDMSKYFALHTNLSHNIPSNINSLEECMRKLERVIGEVKKM